MKAAGDTTFRVRDVIFLSIKVRWHKAEEIYGGAPRLATKMLLGTVFIDKKVNRAESKSQQLIARSRRAVAIDASFEENGTIQFSDCIATRSVRTGKSNLAVCRVGNALTVPRSSGVSDKVESEEAGTYMVEATPIENDGSRQSVAKGILGTLPHQSFHVIFANTSKV